MMVEVDAAHVGLHAVEPVAVAATELAADVNMTDEYVGLAGASIDDSADNSWVGGNYALETWKFSAAALDEMASFEMASFEIASSVEMASVANALAAGEKR